MSLAFALDEFSCAAQQQSSRLKSIALRAQATVGCVRRFNLGELPQMATRTCRVHYRRLIRDGGRFPDASLSDRIKAALDTNAEDGTAIRSKVAHRVAPVPSQPDYQRALNNYDVGDSYVFGTTCLFAPGQMQALLKLTGDEAQADLATVLEAFEIAETAAPEGHEYLHGLSYWLAIEDHFYQIQHASLQSGAMEQYLTWLLREKANVIPDNHQVTLQSVFDQAQLADDEPSFIQVGGIVPETLRAPPPDAARPATPADIVEIEERERLGGGMLGFSKGMEILEELYGSMRAHELLAMVPDEASLEVSVNIGFRARKRKLQKAFMKDLAAGLRNLPDGEVTVRTRSGTAKGADARLYHDMSFKKVTQTSSLLELERARDQMLEVHRRFLHDGKIEP